MVDFTSIEARLSALETKAKADVASARSWLKNQWPHFVTWIGILTAFIAKHL